ncbi:hypothetical protein M501DRAFT_999236 [Patellaria atrata CBS 101060]|uniref:MAPEG family protein n=1 Tax=Patellaria atrata CBS 101060 TaxID=1346257 RepID=A0A9P4S3U6_9PEZI|nr:hypothetical protein M501DRAFT_999236 [Patellaria atrata CBS 101060]
MSAINKSLLAPVVGLNLWTFAMEAWMYGTRVPAISRYNVKIDSNATKAQFDAQLPGFVRWKADNYNHLLEQPTQFYAIMVTLAVLSAGDKRVDLRMEAKLAWVYVGLRIIHSLIQSLGNTIWRRFCVFLASSGVLLILTIRTAMLVF